PHLHPAHAAAELPSQRKRTRRNALGDRAARVALDLIAASESQLTTDRREPARQPLRVRHRVPEVLDGCLVHPPQRDAARRLSVALEYGHAAFGRVQVRIEVHVHRSPFLSIHLNKPSLKYARVGPVSREVSGSWRG